MLDFFFMAILIAIIMFASIGKMNPHMLMVGGGANMPTGAGKDITLYYAPWCGHCQKLEPTWNKVEQHLKSDPAVKVNKINCEEHPHLAKQEGVNGFPTIILKANGKKKIYQGDRSFNDIINFVKN